MISSDVAGVDNSISIDPCSHSRQRVNVVNIIATNAIITADNPGTENQREFNSGLNKYRTRMAGFGRDMYAGISRILKYALRLIMVR